MPSYLNGAPCPIPGRFAPKRAPSMGQNAHFAICKSVAFIAIGMAVTFISEYWHICKTYVSLHAPITWMIFILWINITFIVA